MSTKTTFKRIALVAVAALGLGVLSVAPSQAGVTGLTVTNVAGTSSINKSDSTTAATITVSGLIDSGLNAADSITVTFITKDVSANTAAVARLSFMDTTSGSTIATPVLVSSAARGSYTAAKRVTKLADVAAASLGTSDSKTAADPFVISAAAATQFGAKFALQMESTTTSAGTAGSFTYTVIASSYNGATLIATQTADVTITVNALASAATTVSAANSFAKMSTGTTALAQSVASGADASVSGVSTAGTTVGYIYLGIRNASNTFNVAADSVTATITGAGQLCTSASVCGTSLLVNATSGDQELTIKADGRAGVATVNISTTVNTYAAKTVTFYAKAAKTITAAVAHPVLKVGANTGAVSVAAVDANGTNWTGTAYIVASSAADALVAGSATTPVQCAAYDSTDGILCPVSALTPGTAKFKVIDAATVALATATSNEVTVTVSAQQASSVKLAFDKATYAPFEKATITVTPVDAAGKNIPGQQIATLFATGGITSTIGFSGGSDTLTAVLITTSPTTGSASYTVYMPAASGDVTISATGGASLPGVAQVKYSATASVVNSSVDAATDAANEATDAANAATDAALAAADAADAATAAAQDASDAVAALSASVSKLISSLRAQITSLTNLVIKIQKKVRA
jgi:trimeric autotransporter adhesin